MRYNALAKHLIRRIYFLMTEDQDVKEFNPDLQIVVTGQMVAAGVKIML